MVCPVFLENKLKSWMKSLPGREENKKKRNEFEKKLSVKRKTAFAIHRKRRPNESHCYVVFLKAGLLSNFALKFSCLIVCYASV